MGGPSTPGLNSSTDQWLAKLLRMQRISASYIAGQISTSTGAFQSTIGDPGQPAAGNTITYSALIGKSLIAIFINGTALNTADYTFTSGTGEIDLTSYGGVTNGAEIIILYN